MRTAIYARTQAFSPERDEIQEQITVCMERTESQDIEIYKDYGAGIDTYRPELLRMMKDIRDGKIQRLIVRDFARPTRDLPHLSALTREIEECGCTVLSVADGIDTSCMYDGDLRELITIWDKRRRMHEMEDSGRYRFYGENIDEIPDDQVVDRYMQMMNFLSDARTHDY